jgi:hypothetical protein
MSDDKRVGFFAYETVGASETDVAGLARKLEAADDWPRYTEPHNGAGWTDIEVLPQLRGRPLDNLALAWLHAVRPSAIRVSRGVTCTDMRTWRVTVHLGPDDRIERVTQEVAVGYGCGGDLCEITRARDDGREPRPAANVIGHTAALARVEF